MGLLDGQIVLVTGGAQGIGEEIARTVVAAGAAVLIADLQLERGQKVAADLLSRGHRAEACFVDIAQPSSAESMALQAIRTFGRVDALVNNAGIDSPRGNAWDIDDDHWRRVVDVDLNGPWWCTKALLPHMLARGSGRVIFISSISARAGALGFSPAYAAAKAGLIGLTVSLSLQLEARGILVNAIMPGMIGTTGSPLTDVEREAYLAAHPLGFGTAKPVAHAVEYLLGPAGNWLSGAVLNVSGGRWRGM